MAWGDLCEIRHQMRRQGLLMKSKARQWHLLRLRPSCYLYDIVILRRLLIMLWFLRFFHFRSHSYWQCRKLSAWIFSVFAGFCFAQNANAVPVFFGAKDNAKYTANVESNKIDEAIIAPGLGDLIIAFARNEKIANLCLEENESTHGVGDITLKVGGEDDWEEHLFGYGRLCITPAGILAALAFNNSGRNDSKDTSIVPSRYKAMFYQPANPESFFSGYSGMVRRHALLMRGMSEGLFEFDVRILNSVRRFALVRSGSTWVSLIDDIKINATAEAGAGGVKVTFDSESALKIQTVIAQQNSKKFEVTRLDNAHYLVHCSDCKGNLSITGESVFGTYSTDVVISLPPPAKFIRVLRADGFAGGVSYDMLLDAPLFDSAHPLKLKIGSGTSASEFTMEGEPTAQPGGDVVYSFRTTRARESGEALVLSGTDMFGRSFSQDVALGVVESYAHGAGTPAGAAGMLNAANFKAFIQKTWPDNKSTSVECQFARAKGEAGLKLLADFGQIVKPGPEARQTTVETHKSEFVAVKKPDLLKLVDTWAQEDGLSYGVITVCEGANLTVDEDLIDQLNDFSAVFGTPEVGSTHSMFLSDAGHLVISLSVKNPAYMDMAVDFGTGLQPMSSNGGGGEEGMIYTYSEPYKGERIGQVKFRGIDIHGIVFNHIAKNNYKTDDPVTGKNFVNKESASGHPENCTVVVNNGFLCTMKPGLWGDIYDLGIQSINPAAGGKVAVFSSAGELEKAMTEGVNFMPFMNGFGKEGDVKVMTLLHSSETKYALFVDFNDQWRLDRRIGTESLFANLASTSSPSGSMRTKNWTAPKVVGGKCTKMPVIDIQYESGTEYHMPVEAMIAAPRIESLDKQDLVVKKFPYQVPAKMPGPIPVSLRSVIHVKGEDDLRGALQQPVDVGCFDPDLASLIKANVQGEVMRPGRQGTLILTVKPNLTEEKMTSPKIGVALPESVKLHETDQAKVRVVVGNTSVTGTWQRKLDDLLAGLTLPTSITRDQPLTISLPVELASNAPVANAQMVKMSLVDNTVLDEPVSGEYVLPITACVMESDGKTCRQASAELALELKRVDGGGSPGKAKPGETITLELSYRNRMSIPLDNVVVNIPLANMLNIDNTKPDGECIRVSRCSFSVQHKDASHLEQGIQGTMNHLEPLGSGTIRFSVQMPAVPQATMH